MTYAARVQALVEAGNRLCVGIDPHAPLLDAWGLENTASGAEHLGRAVVAAAHEGGAQMLKPQIAFFERFASAGFIALERVLADARAAGLIVVGDVKRGDIDSTQDAYAEAWLTPGSPLEVDAITISPYLGVAALEGTYALADKHGKGTFTLVATSNPGAGRLQKAVVGESGSSVAADVVASVSAHAERLVADGTWSPHGFVLGATVDFSEFDLPEPLSPVAPILAPGFGHQGASPDDLQEIFGSLAPSVIIAESRSILGAGPTGIVDAIRKRLS